MLRLVLICILFCPYSVIAEVNCTELQSKYEFKLKSTPEIVDKLNLLNELLAECPDSYRVHYNLAYYYLKIDQLSEALEYADKSRRLKSTSLTETLFGVVSLKLKDIEAARAAFKRALNLSPENISATLALVSILKEDQQYDQAIAILERNLAVQNNPDLQLALANLLYLKADFTQALKVVKDLNLKRKKQNLDFIVELEYKNGSYNSVVDYYNAHLQEFNKEPKLLNILALSYVQLNNHDRAEKVLKVCVDRFPSYQTAHKNLAKIQQLNKQSL